MNVGNDKGINEGIEPTNQIGALHMELLPHHGTAEAGIESLIPNLEFLRTTGSILPHHLGPRLVDKAVLQQGSLQTFLTKKLIEDVADGSCLNVLHCLQVQNGRC